VSDQRGAGRLGPREPRPDLLQRAFEGDRFALGELWDDWNPTLLRFLRSLRVSDPEDVAAEVWVDLARSMPQIGPDPDGFRRLLFAIGRRRAVDARRRWWRKPEWLTDPHSYREVVAPDPDVDERVGNELLAQSLLARLPAAQAEVVALRVVAGFSAAETATITGRSEGAVRIMAMRALRQLRDLAIAEGLAPASGATNEVLRAGSDELPSAM